MTVRPRPHLADLPPVVHGGITDAELAALGLDPADVLDFSASTNPLGPSRAAAVGARAAAWDRYPDDGATALRLELARRNGVDPDAVVVGNGAAELVWLVALAFLEPGDRALVVGPTFGEYARAARLVGGHVDDHRARPEDGFAVDPAVVAARARAARSRVLFLCDPNNPTGTLLPPGAIAALADAVPDALLVVDESYRPFADDPPDLRPLLGRGNVLLLRSLTKDHGLAGLRLGYTLAPPPVRAALERVRPPWSVNAVAQAAGLAALRDEAHLARARAEVRRTRAFLSSALAAHGLRVLPAAANFLLVEVGDGAALRAALLRRGVCVRDCASFGLPGHVRIGLRPVPDCERLVAAVAELAAGGALGKAGAVHA